MLTLFLMAGLLLADPTLENNVKTDKTDRKLYGYRNPTYKRSGPGVYMKSTRGFIKSSLGRRHLQGDEVEGDGSHIHHDDPVEQTFEEELERSEDDLDAELQGHGDSQGEEQHHEEGHEAEVNDERVRELLSHEGVEIDATLTYEGAEGPVTVHVKIQDFKIVGEPSDISLEDGHFIAEIVVKDHEGKAFSSKFKIDNGELKNIESEEAHDGEHGETHDGEHGEEHGDHETEAMTLIHRDGSDIIVEEIQTTDNVITAEEPGRHLEDEIIVADAIIHHQDGDEVKSMIFDHGKAKETTDSIQHTGSVPIPDLTSSEDIYATLLEITPTEEKAFEGEIQHGAIVNDGSLPEELLHGEHDLTVITHEDGTPALQHVHEVDGVITEVEGIHVDTPKDHVPEAEVAGTGILVADAIVETQDGPVAEPIVFNNGEMTQAPAESHLMEGPKDIDVVVHDPTGPHMEHVHLEDGHVVQAIADETSISGVAQEGEKHVDVLVHDTEGYHVEDILVKDEQIVEEPSTMDLEHGEHVVETLVHDNTGPHIEHWQIEEGMIMTHHAEGYVETHGHSQSAMLNSSEIRHSTTQLENGTVHVEMLLNYGKQATVEDVLLHNGLIVEQSPGIDLMHGIHVAEAITKGTMGPQIEPVVVHDGIVEHTEQAVDHQEEAPIDVTHGDHHAQMIEGEGAAAKIDEVTIHDGKIVEESGPIDLQHGTHVVETIIEEGGQPHIETDVVIDGQVKHTGTEAQHALMVVKEGENTEVSEVEIENHKIIEQSEGTDLTHGVFVGTEIDINADGSVGETKEVVGNNGEISEVTTHIAAVDTHPAESGDALLVVDTPEGTQVDQIHYDGPTITSETGPIDLSGHQTGIEIVLDPQTHQVQNAEQVNVDGHQITVIDPAHETVGGVEVQPLEAPVETIVHDGIIPTTEHIVEEQAMPVDQQLHLEQNVAPVSRRAFVKPSLYSKAYRPIQKRGLYNSNNRYINNIRRTVNNRIATSQPARQYMKRISYHPNAASSTRFEARRQQVVHRIAPSYRIGHRSLTNTRVSRVPINPLRATQRPIVRTNVNRRVVGGYIRQPIRRYNAAPSVIPFRPRNHGIYRAPYTNFANKNITRSPVHYLKI